MTLTLSIIQKSYDLTVEINGVTLTSTLVASSHTHPADEISDASALGRNILRAADAATVRTLIGAGTGGGAGLSDGDHGGVIVSGGGTVLGLDYAEINATVQPAWSRITALPNSMAGFGIEDGLTTAAAALAYQPLSAVLTATTASYTTAEKNKLAAIAAGATANATDAQLRDRSTHTGQQPASSISDFAAAADARVTAGITGKADLGHTHAFADLTAKPTDLAGYGIKNAAQVPWVTPATGELIMTNNGASSGATDFSTGTTAAMMLALFVPRADFTSTDALVNVVTAGSSGAIIKIVLYSSDSNGRPLSPLLTSSDIDVTTTGQKTSAFSYAFKKGVTYWIGHRCSGSPTLSAWHPSSIQDINGGTTVQTSRRKALFRSVTYASAAPDPWNWNGSEITTSLSAAVWLRV